MRTRSPAWLFFSAVSGGPLERLATSLRAGGRDARLVYGSSASQWRHLAGRGRLGRTWARFRAMCIYPLQALVALAGGGARIAVVSTNPFFLPLFLVATRWIHRKRVVALVYDLYPDALEGTGLVRRDGLASRLWSAGNRFLFRHAQGVVFIGHQMGAHARERYGEPRRWVVLETGADPREFEARPGGASGDLLQPWCGDSLLLAYVGNLGPLHDWETLAGGIEAIGPSPSGSRVRFLFMASGAGLDRLKDRFAGRGELVRFLPQVSDPEWAEVMRRVDVALVTLRSAARHTSVPSKTFSAMAAGAAILAVAPEGSDLAETVRSAACGPVVEPGDVQGFARALTEMLEGRGSLEAYRAASRVAVQDRYGIPVLARKWEAFLGQMEEG